MPLGPFESEILRCIAKNRSPDSHVAGATVLNLLKNSPRTSKDIDIFHDTKEALTDAFTTDCLSLKESGYEIAVQRDLDTFKRAVVSSENQKTKIEWVNDSAFRFFPTEPDPHLGYRLHRWDAATNKILAAFGRVAIRDYIDVLHLHATALSLGALVWAASGKDGGLSPGFILEEIQRIHRYPLEDYQQLILETPPDPVALKKQWLNALAEAKELNTLLLELDAPYGCFFLDANGAPQTPTRETLPDLKPHFGSLRGCWPRIVDED